MPNEDWGEEVKAVVEPVEGAVPGPELAEDIIAFCSGKLAGFKTPKSVDFIVEMPRDPNGKLYKRKLRDPFWEGRAAGPVAAQRSGGGPSTPAISPPLSTNSRSWASTTSPWASLALAVKMSRIWWPRTSMKIPSASAVSSPSW